MAIQPAFATDSIPKEPGHADLPHAFDAGWQGAKTCELLFEDETTRIGRCVFPPGSGHEKHYHNPHFGYTLEGSTMLITDSTGAREVVTSAGGTWSTTGITVHEAMNIGDTTTSYLIVEPKAP
jgi:quercetin dioxygenase-like cupin family protein